MYISGQCRRMWAEGDCVACRCAGLLLYLLDVTLRMAQQARPVKITGVDACPSATLATLEFNMDPYTPVKPVQVRVRWSCMEQWG